MFVMITPIVDIHFMTATTRPHHIMRTSTCGTVTGDRLLSVQVKIHSFLPMKTLSHHNILICLHAEKYPLSTRRHNTARERHFFIFLMQTIIEKKLIVVTARISQINTSVQLVLRGFDALCLHWSLTTALTL